MVESPVLVGLSIGSPNRSEFAPNPALQSLGSWQLLNASDFAQANRLLRQLPQSPHVILVRQSESLAPDLAAWMTLIATVRSNHPDSSLVLAPWHPDDDEHYSQTLARRLMQSGAFSCLSASYTLEELTSHIDAALGSAERQRSVANFVRTTQAAVKVNEICEAALERLKAVVGWHKATFVLIGEQRSTELTQSPKHMRSLLYYKGYSYREISRNLLVPIEDDEFIQAVVAEAQPCIYPDLINEPPQAWKRQSQTQDVCSWIGLPLYFGQQLIGLITLDHQIPNQYRDVDLLALQEVADVTATAIETTLRRRNLEAVRLVMREISTQHRVEDLLQRILGVIQSELNSTRCTYFRRAESVQAGRNQTRLELWMDERDVQIDKDRFMLEAGQGVAGWVLKHGRSVNLQDTRQHPQFVQRGARWKDPTSLIAVPVRIGPRTIGVICADRNRESFFSSYDLELVEILAEQVATVIERTWTLELLNTTSTEINKLTHKTEVLLGILDHALRLTNATSGAIRRVRRTSDETWHVIEEYSAPPDFNHPPPRLDDASLTRRVLDTGHTVQIAPEFGNLDLMHPILKARGIQTILSTPLRLDNEIIGLISLNSPSKQRFNDVEEFSLQLFANQAAIAIHKAETFEAISRQAEAWKKLGEAAAAVMSNADLETTFFAIAEEALELVNGKYSHLARINRSNGRPQIEFVAAHPRENRRRLQQEVGPIDLESGSALKGDRLGITGLAVRNARPYLVRDVKLDVDEATHPDTDIILHYIRYQTDTRSELAVPIIDENDQVIGVINIEHPDPNALTTDHVEILKLFAAQAAIAIQKDSLLSVKSRRERQLASLAEVTQAIIAAQPDKLRQTLQHVVQRIRDALGVMDVIVVRMRQVEETDPRTVSVVDLFACRDYQTEVAVRGDETSITRWVFMMGQRREIADAQQEPGVNPHMKAAGVRAALCLPLRSRGGKMGVLWLHFAEPRLTDYDAQELELFQVYADQIALAYDVVQQAIYDRAQAEKDRQLLKRQRDEITADLASDYSETRKQARNYFILSFTSSVSGLVLASIGLSGIVSGSFQGVTIGSMATLVGILSQVAAIFVFQRADNANRRMDQYHSESLQFRQLSILIDYASQLDQPEERARQKQSIMGLVLQRWFTARSPGSKSVTGPVPPLEA
jgi:GAF domain-containing protein